MAAKVKFPIRRKLALFMALVVLVATTAYFLLATRIFYEDKTVLLYELNTQGVKTVASQIEAKLTKTIDKVNLLTIGEGVRRWNSQIFATEPDLVAYTLFERQSKWTLIRQITRNDYLKTYGIQKEKILEKVQSHHRNLDQWYTQGIQILNGTNHKIPIPLAELIIPLRSQKPTIAIVHIRTDSIQKLMRETDQGSLFVVDRLGHILAHTNSEWVKSSKDLSDSPLVQEAISSPIRFKTREFLWKERQWIGAFGAVGIGGLQVISQFDQKTAYRAAYKLAEKAILLAALVLAIALFITQMISKKLVHPLNSLTEATTRLAQWNFDTQAKVTTQDEIGKLAQDFNSMAKDIQRQKQEIDSNQEELEIKVKQRTAALAEEKKKASEAQDALIRTTKLASLGEVAGAAAHEVLNPINNINIRIDKIHNSFKNIDQKDADLLGEIIQGWEKSYQSGSWDQLKTDLSKEVSKGQSLLDEDLNNLKGIAIDTQKRMTSYREDLDFVTTEITRITKIVNNMRALSRVGGERKPLDIHIPLDDTAVALSDTLQSNQIELIKEYSGELRSRFFVTADKDELVQVFSNLVRNASHAILQTGRKDGQIRFQTTTTDERVEIRVKDNGCGISQDHVDRIFESSFSTKDIREGTGLGLGISRRIVRAFDGDILLESSIIGEGTCFLVWFPHTNPG